LAEERAKKKSFIEAIICAVAVLLPELDRQQSTENKNKLSWKAKAAEKTKPPPLLLRQPGGPARRAAATPISARRIAVEFAEPTIQVRLYRCAVFCVVV